MPISFNCPNCGTFTQVDDQFAGQSGPCKSCGNAITIPFAAAATGKVVPAPASSSSTAAVIVVVCLVAVFGLIVVGGVLIALLLPAVQAAREAARRSQCTGNVKQIALAMHNYHDTYNAFPPAYTTDEDGNKLHSWRTLLLPFMEQQQLYEQIDLSKPWDAPQNRHLFDTVIPTYGCPSDPGVGSAVTSYMVIVGTEALFTGDQQTSFRDVTDGTSNTIMIAEVKGKQVPWGEPTDLTLAEMQMQINGGDSRSAAPGAGSYHPGGINVGMADASVRFLPETIDSQHLKAMTTRRGGEKVLMQY